MNSGGSKRIAHLYVWAIVAVACVQALPRDVNKGGVNGQDQNPQARQEDEDEASLPTAAPFQFGTSVAQIITGALTGNIDSIIKGSFGFIPVPEVNQLSHNTWETLKGNPTKMPAWVTTVEPDEDAKPAVVATAPPATAPPVPAAADVQQAPPAVVQQAAPVVAQQAVPAEVQQVIPVVQEAAQPQSPAFKPAVAGPPPVYQVAPDSYPDTSIYSYSPTKSPTRTTQPTYATLASIQAIEGQSATESEPEETTSASVTTTDADDEDVDEAESGETETKEETTTADSDAIVVTPATYSGTDSTKTSVTESEVETTTEEDDQDQIDNENTVVKNVS